MKNCSFDYWECGVLHYYILLSQFLFKERLKEIEMRVLVACEESQAVCKAFRERGHTPFSCEHIVNICEG